MPVGDAWKAFGFVYTFCVVCLAEFRGFDFQGLKATMRGRAALTLTAGGWYKRAYTRVHSSIPNLYAHGMHFDTYHRFVTHT